MAYLYRDHRGSYDDAMKTVIRVHTQGDIIAHLSKVFPGRPIYVKLEYNMFDVRNNWDTWYVMCSFDRGVNWFVAGFANGNVVKEEYYKSKGNPEFFDGQQAHPKIIGNFEDYLEQPGETFRIGQSYEDTPARAYQCKKCKGRHFEVAYDEYFTAIKCVNCLYEIGVHEG